MAFNLTFELYVNIDEMPTRIESHRFKQRQTTSTESKKKSSKSVHWKVWVFVRPTVPGWFTLLKEPEERMLSQNTTSVSVKVDQFMIRFVLRFLKVRRKKNIPYSILRKRKCIVKVLILFARPHLPRRRRRFRHLFPATCGVGWQFGFRPE